jgi:uncharacterized protein
MLLEGKFNLKANINETFDTVIKPEVLAACIPGCEKMEKKDDRNYDSVVAAKLGFITVRFQFSTTLAEVVRPTHLKAVGKGSDTHKQGNFTQETVVDLKEIGPDEIEVSYKSNVIIAGKLATFGDRIMRIKAKEMEKQFTENLQKQLARKA